MKKIFTLSSIAVIFAALLTITSCNKDKFVITYTMDDMTACLVANPNNTPQEFTFALDHDDVLAVVSAASVDLSSVKETKLGKIKVVITPAGSANLDQIEGIQVYMKALGTSGDGEQIAHTPSITNGAVEIAFNINGADLKKTLSEDMIITVRVFNKPSGNDPVCIKLTEGTIEITAQKK